MLAKEFSENIAEDKGEVLKISEVQSDKNLIATLEDLGYLPNNFQGGFLFRLLEHDNPKIRLLAAKNIGKLNQTKSLEPLWNAFQKEKNTAAKREIVSAIGRLRRPQNKPYLFEILQDDDPKVVCQAIRGLLHYDDDILVVRKLKPLLNHENEIVRTVIYKEFFAELTRKENAQPHPETYDFLKNVVVNADVRDALLNVPNESIHLTFTSPPYYNARDYSIYPSYDAYLKFLAGVFQETHRITKEGRFLIVNTSPIIIPRVSRAHSSKRYPIPFDLHHYLVKMGWEFIDDIIWLKPEYSVKNRVGGFHQHRKPLGYKPNSITEYLMVYRKETTRLLDWNMRSYSQKAVEESKVSGEYETTNVWRIDPKFDKVHSAVFPVELCKRVIQYYSYKGDLVFDPFAGSGTVGRTAKSLDRCFFLTEKEKDYFDYMKSKAKDISENLFDTTQTRFLGSIKEFTNFIAANQ
ncbi:MAG: DNA methyltransferase [Pyrinomonadaceae bacterium]